MLLKDPTDILLLEFSCDVSLDKGGFPDTAIAYEDELELRDWLHGLHLLDMGRGDLADRYCLGLRGEW